MAEENSISEDAVHQICFDGVTRNDVVCGRCLSSTRTHRPMEWKREIARSALSLARSTQAERDNESCVFVRAAGIYRFIKRYHVKRSKY
ncbi:hypothetical protein EVAR_100127_1 [Eumeta japonica]|uniref:Uncharacterized protein n=1 Tax=Eumeta variegata TaxID=151549 RepID=A0A4C1ZP15_EUMVA|nr:hypothetical protein EVAR_100127_1 [Eumeta japonica]